MTSVDLPGAPLSGRSSRFRKSSALTRLLAAPGFQAWAARFPLTRRFVRREGEAMFDLVAGFCHSQILMAFVRLDLPRILLDAEYDPNHLAKEVDVPADRMQVLLSATRALGLTKRRRSGHIALTMRGAALAGVPGLSGMIDHHDILYRDLADPVAFFKGDVETELAEFWPYVFGAGGATDPAVTQRYSELMADSQVLVAQDTLATVGLHQARVVMDVGGGSGAFLAAVAAKHPALDLRLFDLPAVAPHAQARFDGLGLSERLTVLPGSFRDDDLPAGADVISLVRVLYDHDDETVTALLANVHRALPAGGQLIVSEPMTGGDTPERAGDAYFALYCMAMRTGRARSAEQITHLMTNAGFEDVRAVPARRPFVTSVVTGVRKS